jgi:hypothetical protein
MQEAIYSGIHKIINSTFNREELPQQWTEPVIVPVYKKGDKTDCSNYRDMSLLPTTYKTLSNSHVSMLTLYVDEITGDRHCGFRRST